MSALMALLGLAHAAPLSEMKASLDSISIHKLDSVRGNLHLPSKTPDGFEITWSSSNTSVVSVDGWVTRQPMDTPVNLTAAISSNGGAHRRVFSSTVKAAVELAEFEGYAFSYFTGSSLDGENIFFAASDGNDALSWTELNGGEPVLTSSEGTGGLRDPFMIRSPEGDTFYLIATDLSIGSGTSWDEAVRNGSHYVEIWESTDLITWSDQRHIRVAPENAGNTWAPEAYYDDEIGAYLLFWASSLYQTSDHSDESYHRMMYATTRDFVTFSEPVIWQDAGMSRIDSTVLQSEDVYYRFTKDEGASGTGCSDIIQESSLSLSSTLDSWSIIATCIGRDAGTQSVEGPTAFKSNTGDINGEKFYLFVDEYVDRGYIPLETDHIGSPNWKVSASYNLPTSPRHGTVIPVTAAELKSLRSGYQVTGQETLKARQDESEDLGVLPDYYADPNIVTFAGDCNYYIYATTDGFPNWGGQEFYVWSSPDLVNWTRTAEPILVLNGTDGNVPWATGNAWAPTIAKRYGKFYFYFSGNNPEYDDAKTMGVAVGDSPLGPFTAQPEPLVTGLEDVATSGGSIDPYVLADPESDIYYLYWGNGSPVYAQLNDDMVSVNWDTAAEQDGLLNYREASFVSYRQGTYHMTYSINDTRSEEYQVGYATAPTPDGPWSYQGVILHKDAEKGILATGHNSVLNVPGTDDWYIAYHRFKIPDGNGTQREVTIDRLTFDEETGLMNKVVPTVGGVDAQVIPGCEKKCGISKKLWDA